MAFAQGCLLKLEELFCLIEEKRVGRFSALNLSNSRQKYNSLDLMYSCKSFRLFYKESKITGLEISISKKFFKLAVERNKIKRRIKEIFRKKSLLDLTGGVIVFSVFRPFGELSYSEALVQIESAVKSFVDGVNKK